LTNVSPVVKNLHAFFVAFGKDMEEKMYKVNDLIVYGNEGVCKVEAIEVMNVTAVANDRLYYVLKPLYRNGTVFTPVDTKVFMRPVISADDAQEIIEQIPSIETDVLYSSANLLSDHYDKAMERHDCKYLIQVIKTVYLKNQIAATKNKKVSETDRRYMKKAEDMLYGEFAVVLEMPKNDVKAYVEEKVAAIELSLIKLNTLNEKQKSG
jgi:CarD family transcriptional regulator